jgi:type I restriction enzyme S subunit
MGKRSSPYIGQTERTITDEGLQNSSARLLPPNSVILSSRAPIGYLVINTEPMASNQGCKGLVPGDRIDHKFLFYYLASIISLLNDIGSGATFKELSGGKLKDVTVPVPPLPEQQRIVNILDEAFEGIATAKANAEKNLQNARAIFESHLQSVFTQRGKGWVERSLEELGTITSSKRIFKSEYVKSGIPFYRTKEVKELANGREISTELFISEVRYNEIKTSFGVPKPGDILLTAIGTIGEIFVVEGNDEFYFKDGNVLWLKDFKTINPHFLKYALVSFVESLNKMAHGSAYSALTIQRLNVHRIFVPSLAEQAAIVARLNSLSAETQRLESIYQQKLAALEELKKSLLHQAFGGNL